MTWTSRDFRRDASDLLAEHAQMLADEARAAAQDATDDGPTRREIESEDEWWERYGWATGGES